MDRPAIDVHHGEPRPLVVDLVCLDGVNAVGRELSILADGEREDAVGRVQDGVAGEISRLHPPTSLLRASPLLGEKCVLCCRILSDEIVEVREKNVYYVGMHFIEH